MVEFQDWFEKYNQWSFSKHRLWHSCKLSYYYRYIGTALRESTEFDIGKLKRLKDLKSRFALQGILVHEVLENQLNQHYLGRDVIEEAAKTQYSNRIEQYRKTATDTIIEHYNGLPFDDRFYDIARSEGIDKLGMFFGVIWPQYKSLEYLRHEKFDHVLIEDVKCIVKVDFVSKTREDLIVVSDWKTGADKEEYESDLQIGMYVIWAMDFYKKELEDVRSEMVYLTTGVMRPNKFENEQIDTIKKTAVEEYNSMNESYNIEDFEPNPQPRKCLGCQFSTICPHSKAREEMEN